MLKFKPMIKTVIATFLIGASQSALADSSSHYWIRIPQTQRSCQDEAKALADRFSVATGAQIQAATCTDKPTLKADGKSYTLYSLDIAYTVKQEASAYSILISPDLHTLAGTRL